MSAGAYVIATLFAILAMAIVGRVMVGRDDDDHTDWPDGFR